MAVWCPRLSFVGVLVSLFAWPACRDVPQDDDVTASATPDIVSTPSPTPFAPESPTPTARPFSPTPIPPTSTPVLDVDGDGFPGTADDCDDNDASVYPGADEIPYDGVDQDCSGQDLTDVDGDSFTGGDGGDDCDDASAAVYPGASEVCDGLDNDCDGAVDDHDADVIGATEWYPDADGDSYGADTIPVVLCTAPEGYVAQNGDCDDTDPGYHPGAEETDCTDPNDYNCDGSVGYADGDGDGFPACTECDDDDSTVNPGAVEVCNGVDDDCDGLVDDADPDLSESPPAGTPQWYLDADGDGFGDAASVVLACSAPDGYVGDSTDCNDGDPTIEPTTVWYLDADGDGYGNPAASLVACAPPDTYVLLADDCNDLDSRFHPGSELETCSDPNDYDCDGVTTFADDDGDGYPACEDCNDSVATVNPGAEEVCNEIDDDCDELVDDADSSLEGAQTWYLDADGDSFGDSERTTRSCLQPDGYVGRPDDCDDADAAVFPDAPEFCNAVDDDCDGGVDEGTDASAPEDASTWYADSDGDGFGDPDFIREACAMPEGFVADGSDCDDADAATYPGAEEVCDDADNNCDGASDNGAAGGGPNCAVTDCQAILEDNPDAPDGFYWLAVQAGETPFQTWCDMTTDGGGWTLVLQASSNSAYVYDHPVWTDSDAASPGTPDPHVDQDVVSPAFYELAAVESMLCLDDHDHCVAWNHGEDTARNLANGPRAYTIQESAASCDGFKCGPNTLPQAFDAVTSGTYSDTYYRFGYVNDVNGWGTSIRVGFSGDGDSSDSSDTAIGVGLACTGSCSSNSTTDGPHGSGAGFYLYHGWAEAPYDGPLKAYLYVRPRRHAEELVGEICSDGLDNDGDGIVDEGLLGDTPACAAQDCAAILDARPDATDGIYWVFDRDTGDPWQTYCDMTTDGGGWTLVLQTSHVSSFNYNHAVWSASSAALNLVHALDPGVDQDGVSPLFYQATSGSSMLCMGDLQHCNAWVHDVGTPRDLVNGPRMASSQGASSVCDTFFCGSGTLPANIRDATSGTWSATWHRWGYVNDENGWGTRTRVGFTGDTDSSDSSDTIIGLGVDCYGACLSYSVSGSAHGTGSGFYLFYRQANTPYDGPLPGFLFIR